MVVFKLTVGLQLLSKESDSALKSLIEIRDLIVNTLETRSKVKLYHQAEVLILVITKVDDSYLCEATGEESTLIKYENFISGINLMLDKFSTINDFLCTLQEHLETSIHEFYKSLNSFEIHDEDF